MNRIFILNPKGGSGKSTLSIHTTIGFASLGYKVLLIDTDVDQLTSYTFFNNRKEFIEKYEIDLPMFSCVQIPINNLVNYVLNESKNYDFIIVDSPGSSLHEYTHDIINVADTILITLNESFIDLQALKISVFFAELCKLKDKDVLGSRNKRNITIITTRRSPIWSHHQEDFYKNLQILKKTYNIDFIEGFFESISFKDMFRLGLTILDNSYLNTTPSTSQNKAILSIKNYIKYIVQKMLTNQYLQN